MIEREEIRPLMELRSLCVELLIDHPNIIYLLIGSRIWLHIFTAGLFSQQNFHRCKTGDGSRCSASACFQKVLRLKQVLNLVKQNVIRCLDYILLHDISLVSQ